MIEFTGERVIPGEVDVDLWNEHYARYEFAARLAAGKRVLDAGCGAGYGSSALAREALTVTAFDLAPEAVAYARRNYSGPNLRFLQGSCTAMPLAAEAFDLVVAFEVIEHLADWRVFLEECRRVLAPGGSLLVSTPNREYYAESRRLVGPNPFHAHEFDYQEFASALGALFPHVLLHLENHVEGIAIQPECLNGLGPELRQATLVPDPGEAHFFVALCSAAPQAASTPFLYIPSAANVLRERERHIAKLELDVASLRQDKEKLVGMFREQEAALEEGNRWSRDLDAKLAAAAARILELQTELQQTAAGYQAQIGVLEADNNTKTEWARQLDEKLAAASARIVELQTELQETTAGYEAQIAVLQGDNDAKTDWARQLDLRVIELQAELRRTTPAEPPKAGQPEREDRAAAAPTHDSEQLADQLAAVVELKARLDQAVADYDVKLAALVADNCAKTTWGKQLTTDLDRANHRLQELEESFATCRAGYEAKIAELEREDRAKAAWALGLQEEVDAARRQIELVNTSRWVKLGNRLGLGPKPSAG